MDLWRIREKHHNTFRKVCKELGFFDPSGRMRKWDGKKFYARFAELGHTSAKLEECDCYKREPLIIPDKPI